MTHRGNVFPFIHPQGCAYILFRRMKGRIEGLQPWGKRHLLGTKFTPGGQLRPWKSNFAPRGELKTCLFDCLHT
jgi:hypothetical protein